MGDPHMSKFMICLPKIQFTAFFSYGEMRNSTIHSVYLIFSAILFIKAISNISLCVYSYGDDKIALSFGMNPCKRFIDHEAFAAAFFGERTARRQKTFFWIHKP